MPNPQDAKKRPTRSTAKASAAKSAVATQPRRGETPNAVLLDQIAQLDLGADPVMAWRSPGGIVHWNHVAAELYGFPADEALGKPARAILKTQYPSGLSAADIQAAVARDGGWSGELEQTAHDGRRVFVEARLKRVDGAAAGRGLLVIETHRDVTVRKLAEVQARTRARLQEALSQLGRAALSAEDAEAFLNEATARVAEVLGAPYAQIQELAIDGKTLSRRAGVGWRKSVAGTVLDAGPSTLAGFTLLAGEPLVVADFRTERRFAPPAGVRAVSGLSVVIPGQPRAYGVLSVYTREAREFTADEIHFLRAVANVLGNAVRNDRADRAIRDSEERMRAVFDTAVDAIITIDERGLIDAVNPATERLLGYSSAELVGRNVSMIMPEPYRGRHDGYLASYMRTGRAKIIGIGREVVGQKKDGTTFPLDLAVSEFKVRGRRMFTGVIHDLTDRRRLEREIVEAASEEQRRIGQDLHDGLCQQLTGCAFALEVLGQKLSARAAPETASIRKVSELVDQAITQARELARGLHPVSLEASGLESALRVLAERSETFLRTPCMFLSRGEVQVYNNTVATHLYRIAQEAINNAVKHGKARTILIDLSADDTELTLSVTDDGVGLGRAASDGRGIGLQTMDYRARVIGGRVEIRRGDRGGTTVICTVPVEALERANTEVSDGR